MIDDLNSFGVRREGVARAAYLGYEVDGTYNVLGSRSEQACFKF